MLGGTCSKFAFQFKVSYQCSFFQNRH